MLKKGVRKMRFETFKRDPAHAQALNELWLRVHNQGDLNLKYYVPAVINFINSCDLTDQELLDSINEWRR